MGSWPKPLIGLTGGIGTGKSTVAALLAARGAVVIDADRLGHEVLLPGGAAYDAVVAAFGRGILDAGGGIDRAKLGACVFDDPDARKRLEGLTHPAIGEELRQRLAAAMGRGAEVPAVVLEIVLLVENNYQSLVDEVWVTTAQEQTVIARVADRSGLTAAEVRARRAAQLSDADRLAVARVVLPNDGTVAELEALVEVEWRRVLAAA